MHQIQPFPSGISNATDRIAENLNQMCVCLIQKAFVLLVPVDSIGGEVKCHGWTNLGKQPTDCPCILEIEFPDSPSDAVLLKNRRRTRSITHYKIHLCAGCTQLFGYPPTNETRGS